MNQPKNHVHAYRSVQVTTANQGTIIVMLYNEVIHQIDRARDELGSQSKKYDKVNAALIKARDIITELMVSLDFDKGDAIAKNLFGLYHFFNSKLIEANVKKELAPLNEIYPLICDLRDSWDKISTVSVENAENVPSRKNAVDISG